MTKNQLITMTKDMRVSTHFWCVGLHVCRLSIVQVRCI